MAQSYCQLWVHLIWVTKERQPWLRKEYRWEIIEHVRSKADEKDYHIDIVNGVEDHLHALVAYKPTHTVSRIINDIKGESSNWINMNNILKLDFNFRWQPGYAAFSVSPKAVKNVRAYILNQEEHHRKFSFDEEIENLDV